MTNLSQENMQKMIEEECDSVKDLLLAKNREYGSSVFEPLNIFSDGNAEEQIKTRIDDKLKRIKTTRNLNTLQIHEDTEQDLIGYLIILKVARRIRINRS